MPKWRRASSIGSVAVKRLESFLALSFSRGGPMRSLFHRFIANEGGATAIEYAVIASLVSIIIVGATTAIGTQMSTLYFGKLGSKFN
jgi:pilus assembly protein Flp/PilA